MPVTDFGIEIGTEHTLESWEKAQAQNALHVEYLGEFKVKEAGGRACWSSIGPILRRRRTSTASVLDLMIYVDKETWLQVGSTLKGPTGNCWANTFSAILN